MKDLLRIIESLETIALRAYWGNHSDCGADFDKDNCPDCGHYEVCKAAKTIRDIKCNLMLEAVSND